MSSALLQRLGPKNKPFHPIGAALKLWRSRDFEVLIEGPVGTGKTRVCLEKLHALCEGYSGTRALIVRQVRASLASTVLVTFEDEVLPEGHYLRDGAQRENRYSYHYRNGSEIVLGGMDDTGKFMSGEFDLVYIPEATQVAEVAIENLLTRLRHGRLGWHQLLMDCNPDLEQHWLNKRCKRGTTRRIISTLEDNPKFWNSRIGSWTAAGAAYNKAIDGLTGHRRRRLKDGVWANAEGARFPNASRHTQGFDTYTLFPQGFPGHWAKWITSDWGIADPYAAYWLTRSPEGVIYCYREDYTPGYEAHQQIERIVSMSPINERYEGIWCDGSMWQQGDYHRSFGAHPERGSAAKQYYAEISKPEHDGRFGALYKARKNVHERNYTDLAAMLDKGQLLIERACTNLWDELEGAIFHRDPRTGIQFEEINPGGKKYCPDHGLESLCGGIIDRTPTTSPIEDHEYIDVAQMMIARERERHEAWQERQESEGRPDWAQRRDNSDWLGVS